MTDKILPGGRVIQPLSTLKTEPHPKTSGKKGDSFQKVLEQKIKGREIQFSKHAVERMMNRSIDLNNQDLKRLDEAVQKAAEKGAKESLVVMGDNAYVVSVKNHTVITAIDGNSMRENVFTNIDSAIIMD